MSNIIFMLGVPLVSVFVPSFVVHYGSIGYIRDEYRPFLVALLSSITFIILEFVMITVFRQDNLEITSTLMIIFLFIAVFLHTAPTLWVMFGSLFEGLFAIQPRTEQPTSPLELIARTIEECEHHKPWEIVEIYEDSLGIASRVQAINRQGIVATVVVKGDAKFPKGITFRFQAFVITRYVDSDNIDTDIPPIRLANVTESMCVVNGDDMAPVMQEFIDKKTLTIRELSRQVELRRYNLRMMDSKKPLILSDSETSYALEEAKAQKAALVMKLKSVWGKASFVLKYTVNSILEGLPMEQLSPAMIKNVILQRGEMVLVTVTSLQNYLKQYRYRPERITCKKLELEMIDHITYMSTNPDIKPSLIAKLEGHDTIKIEALKTFKKARAKEWRKMLQRSDKASIKNPFLPTCSEFSNLTPQEFDEWAKTNEPIIYGVRDHTKTNLKGNIMGMDHVLTVNYHMWIDNAGNILFVGPTRTGKSFGQVAMLRAAVKQFPFRLYIADYHNTYGLAEPFSERHLFSYYGGGDPDELTYGLDVNLVKIPNTTINILKRPNAKKRGRKVWALSATEMMMGLIGTKSQDTETFLYENVKAYFEKDKDCSIQKLWQAYKALPEEEGKVKTYKDRIMVAMNRLDRYDFLMHEDGITSLEQMYRVKEDPTCHKQDLIVSMVGLPDDQKAIVINFLDQLVREFCFSPSPRRSPFLLVRLDEMMTSHPKAIEGFMRLAMWGAKYGLAFNIADHRVKHLSPTVRSQFGVIALFRGLPDDDVNEVLGRLPLSAEERNEYLHAYKEMKRPYALVCSPSGIFKPFIGAFYPPAQGTEPNKKSRYEIDGKDCLLEDYLLANSPSDFSEKLPPKQADELMIEVGGSYECDYCKELIPNSSIMCPKCGKKQEELVATAPCVCCNRTLVSTDKAFERVDPEVRGYCDRCLVKCSSCGTLNTKTAERCRKCEASLSVPNSQSSSENPFKKPSLHELIRVGVEPKKPVGIKTSITPGELEEIAAWTVAAEEKNPYRVCPECGLLDRNKECPECGSNTRRESQIAFSDRIAFSSQQTLSRWVKLCRDAYRADNKKIGRTGKRIANFIYKKLEGGLTKKEIAAVISDLKTQPRQ